MFEYSATTNATKPKQKNGQPLIILGMHRSGTSVLANWLHQCGFNLGDEMIGPGNGNSEGHFEDLEIYRLHKKILRNNLLGYQVTEPTRLRYSGSAIRRAQRLFTEKKESDCWGWKDPRTCLMMDLWNQIIPAYKTIVIFRDFKQVVDSLMRRKRKAVELIKNPVKRNMQRLKYQLFSRHAANRFLKVWIEYNRQILEHTRQRNPEDYLVVDESMLMGTDYLFFMFLYRNWSYKNIHYIPYHQIYKPQLLQRETAGQQFDPYLVTQAERITLELQKLQHYSSLQLLLPLSNQAKAGN